MKFFPRHPLVAFALGAFLLLQAAQARADIHIGVILSLTGPGASLGLPEEQAIRLWPTEIAGQKLRLTVLNDNTDSTMAAQQASKLINEEKVDVIIGSSLTPPSLAIVEAAGQARVPVVSLGGGSAIVVPQEGVRKWAFKLASTEAISARLVLDHLVAHGGKTIGTIGIATSYGEGFLKATEAATAAKGVKLVGVEKYNQTDQSVTAQVVKLMAANPDAIFIFSAGTAGALPHIELVKRNYKGTIYQTQGVANADFLRVGGKDLEGGYMTVSPVLVAEQLPASNPVKKVALDFIQRYEGKHGPGTRSLFGASAWDALLMIQAASTEALKKTKPGTPEFRSALRDGLENLHDFVGSLAVFNMSDKDHNGVDASSQVMVRIKGGKWELVP
jgi:branched-chain amino acid transport system substrate-binding protein